MGRKKRHHYIPKFYLEGFVDPNNKPYIWVYEKGNTNVRKDKAKNIAFQKHYYSFTTKEGNKDSESLENALAKTEGQVAPILQKIRRHKNLDSEGRDIFATFLALMMFRVPNFKRWLEDNRIEIVRQICELSSPNAWESMKPCVECSKKDTGEKIDISNMSMEELRKLFSDDRYDIKIHPELYLGMLHPVYVEHFAKIFYDLRWVFYTATDDYKFVTSDNPLYSNDVSLRDRNLEVTCPISKDLAFFGAYDIEREGYIEADNNLVKEINCKIVASALRFVFSSQKSDELNKLVQESSNIQQLM